MSTHSIDQAARQDARRVMNSALLRMIAVAGCSIVFALIHCTARVDQGQGLTAPATTEMPAVAHAAAAPVADSISHHAAAEQHARPN